MDCHVTEQGARVWSMDEHGASERSFEDKEPNNKQVERNTRPMNEEDAVHRNRMPVSAFPTLPLAAPILKAVEKAGYETPSPIQEKAIPPLLEGSDLLGVAQTGTGKTAYFLCLAFAYRRIRQGAQILCLAPTRERSLCK